MKLVISAVMIAWLLVACTPQQNLTPGKTLDFLEQDGNTKPGDGGVDVGPKGKNPRVFALNKKTLRPIPSTHLFVSVSFGWTESALPNGLELNHQDGSKVVITKASVDGNETPTLEALKKHLQAKTPSRTYSAIQINDSVGLSAEYTTHDGGIESEVYLISEQKDFIHVRLVDRHKTLVLFNTQNVLASIQLQKPGVQPTLSMKREVKLRAGIPSHQVPLLFAQNSPMSLNANDSSKTSGYILELTQFNGADDFDKVSATEDGLVFGDNKTLCDEQVNKIFQSGESLELEQSVELKLGGIYLVRTQNGPFQDIVAKVLVESIEPGHSVTLKYQTLAPIYIGILINQPKPK